jgi:predicted RNA-binding Zn-ribbon protein involved in translation (DUF1610 family)
MAKYQHWDQCTDCGFQGLMEFLTRDDEDYSDEDALGYLVDWKCSSCGHEISVLMVVYEYQEMVRLAEIQS